MVDTARRAVAELAASQHRTFTRRQAAQLNFDRRRVATAMRDGWLDEPLPGVLVMRDAPPTWEQRVMTVVLATGGHGVASHRSAARLLGLDGFDEPGNATVEASVTRDVRITLAIPAVIHHVRPLAACDVARVKGIPCTTRDRTLCDIGSVVPDVLVRRALTDARRRGIRLDRLRASAERLHRPHQRGTGILLRLLDRVPWEGSLPASWFEELVGLCVDSPQLPEVIPQYPIVDASGRIVARTDLGIPSVRLGLEAHSRRFHFGELAERLDEDRDIAAGLCAWELTYLGWYATKHPAEVLRVVQALVDVRRRELRGPDTLVS